MSGNADKQEEEIEVLSSIYGEEWHLFDIDSRIYTIDIKGEREDGSQSVATLQVTLPPDYPSSSPPLYQISAPFLNRRNKQALQNDLEQIYVENMGESILYLWIEKIREFILEAPNQKEHCAEPQNPEPCLTTERAPPAIGAAGDDQEEEEDDIEDYDYDPIADAHAHHDLKLDALALKDTQCPKIFHGDTLLDRKSVFQGHIAEVHSREQVQVVMDKLKESRKIANATHNILAYRILVAGKSNPVYLKGCDDDGEFHASSRMLHLLEIVDATNVMVVVTRWYGGVHLGADRFKHINSITRMMLEEHGYIKAKTEKKTSKKGKKK